MILALGKFSKDPKKKLSRIHSIWRERYIVVGVVLLDPLKQLVLVLVEDKGTGEKEELEAVCMGDAGCQISANNLISTILCGVFCRWNLTAEAWKLEPGSFNQCSQGLYKKYLFKP